ncbi:MAG: carboxypeptidase-like regulatory domain-containing protein [Planctomycetota bacterium]
MLRGGVHGSPLRGFALARVEGVRGRVRSGGQVLADVPVEVRCAGVWQVATRTDAQGAFALIDAGSLPCTPDAVRVALRGFQTWQAEWLDGAEWEIELHGAGSLRRVALEVLGDGAQRPAMCSVELEVRAADGGTVVFEDRREQIPATQLPAVWDVALGDTSGPWSVHVRVQAIGYEEGRAIEGWLPEVWQLPLQIELARAGELRGWVVAEGAAVAGAEVLLLDGEDHILARGTSAAPDGAFALLSKDLEPVVAIEARHEQLASARRPLPEAGGERLAVLLEMTRGPDARGLLRGSAARGSAELGAGAAATRGRRRGLGGASGQVGSAGSPRVLPRARLARGVLSCTRRRIPGCRARCGRWPRASCAPGHRALVLAWPTGARSRASAPAEGVGRWPRAGRGLRCRGSARGPLDRVAGALPHLGPGRRGLHGAAARRRRAGTGAACTSKATLRRWRCSTWSGGRTT